jgi:hypothetical protein
MSADANEPREALFLLRLVNHDGGEKPVPAHVMNF